MKYDDASWHYGGDFPKDLPNEAGATHIAMFVAWCLLNGLAGELHTDDFPEEFELLKNRDLTPAKWFIRACDEKFTDEDLNEKGNSFANFYYQADDAEYASDYDSTLGENYDSVYYIPDTWASYDKLAIVIGKRYESWSQSHG